VGTVAVAALVVEAGRNGHEGLLRDVPRGGAGAVAEIKRPGERAISG